MSSTAPATLLACHDERTWGSAAVLFPFSVELLSEVFSGSITCVLIASNLVLVAILGVKQDAKVCTRMPIDERVLSRDRTF